MNIEKLLSMLESPKADTRFDACELLRVAPQISDEAIAALEKALEDPDRHVRESAESALRVHKSSMQSQDIVVSGEANANSDKIPNRFVAGAIAGGAASLVPVCFIAYLFGINYGATCWGLSILTLVAGGLSGSFIGGAASKTQKAAATLGAIFGLIGAVIITFLVISMDYDSPLWPFLCQ